ncbi:MAG: phosphatidate cytidylyltransferase [Treponema sp.]|nr:phosphatidate cytidylyltransferase [Treponema sp.]
MNKVVSRLFTFFIGVPLVLFIVFFDYMNHLPLNIALSIFSVIGSNELYQMLEKKKKLFPKEFILISTALLTYIAYAFILCGRSLEITPWIFTIEVVLFMGAEVFSAKTFEHSISKIAYSSFIVFYCGFMMTFISRMTVLPNSKYIISLFLIFVFMCDSAAWFFGILFGKNNRGIIAASPNKSIVGFIGGILGSIASGLVFKLIFPEIITCSYINLIFIGLLTALAGIVGDLIESVLKRSCDVKDSGKLIPGRGGVLDSIDSILVAAPVFYIAYTFLF